MYINYGPHSIYCGDRSWTDSFYLFAPLLLLLMKNTRPIRNTDPAIRAAMPPAFIPSPVFAAVATAFVASYRLVNSAASVLDVSVPSFVYFALLTLSTPSSSFTVTVRVQRLSSYVYPASPPLSSVMKNLYAPALVNVISPKFVLPAPATFA